YREPAAWDSLMGKLVEVLSGYLVEQARAGADVLQVFDSWVGCLSPEDYRRSVLPHAASLVRRAQQSEAPVIYFGTDTATLLPAMKETGAEVIGVDWRLALDDAWRSLEFRGAIQGNLDPAALFAAPDELRARTQDVLHRAGGRNGHIFNLGHGILPGTPVENVRVLVEWVREYSAKHSVAAAGNQ
ncbi:MAG: uroporphyrinogen decarboxylase family protein, partial [Terriglobales bacterium]